MKERCEMKSTFEKVYVSFNEMEKSFNKVRKELEETGLVFECFKLDK